MAILDAMLIIPPNMSRLFVNLHSYITTESALQNRIYKMKSKYESSKHIYTTGFNHDIRVGEIHCLLIHYANMSVQYTAIFHGCEIVIFR